MAEMIAANLLSGVRQDRFTDDWSNLVDEESGCERAESCFHHYCHKGRALRTFGLVTCYHVGVLRVVRFPVAT